MWFLVIDKPVAIFSLEHNFAQVYILTPCNDTLHSPMCKILWTFLFILTWTYLHPLPFRRHFHFQEYFTMKQESRMLACLKKMQVTQLKFCVYEVNCWSMCRLPKKTWPFVVSVSYALVIFFHQYTFILWISEAHNWGNTLKYGTSAPCCAAYVYLLHILA